MTFEKSKQFNFLMRLLHLCTQFYGHIYHRAKKYPGLQQLHFSLPGNGKIHFGGWTYLHFKSTVKQDCNSVECSVRWTCTLYEKSSCT